MGVLKVLGLQLCLVALSLGAEARSEWQASDTKDTDEEPNSMISPLSFETRNKGRHQAEAPEFGLEVKHRDPQDFDIMLMTHRVRRSEGKKKRKKIRVGAYATLGSIVPSNVNNAAQTHRARRSKEQKTEKQKRNRNRVGSYAPLGGILSSDVKQLAPEVFRAKRQSGTRPKKRPGDRPGKFSVLESATISVPTQSLD